MKFIVGKKIGMSQIFAENGTVVPVTRVVAGPCQIVQVKDEKHNGVRAVQIGFGEVKEKHVSKPQAGHLKGLNPAKHLRDFRIETTDNVKRGDMLTVELFVPGDKVTVIGQSKGKGFAGVVKRHHFRGGPGSHGHKDNLRMPGAIGAGGVQRVFKGLRMAGRMGGDRVTVKNLEVVAVHPETNELYIKGAVPGGREGLLLISAQGVLKVKEVEAAPVVEQVVEAAPAETQPAPEQQTAPEQTNQPQA